MGRKLSERPDGKQRGEARLCEAQGADLTHPRGRETHRAGHLAGGMLMASTIEAVCTGVYLGAAVAVPLVALRAAARDLCALLRALGDLRAPSVVLFAEIHNCKSGGERAA